MTSYLRYAEDQIETPLEKLWYAIPVQEFKQMNESACEYEPSYTGLVGYAVAVTI